MRKGLALTSLVAFLAFLVKTSEATAYISPTGSDSNLCTVSSRCRTLEYAMTQDVDVIAAAGTYAETATTILRAGGSIIGAGSGGTVFNCANVGGTCLNMPQGNSGEITLTGFTIRGASADAVQAVWATVSTLNDVHVVDSVSANGRALDLGGSGSMTDVVVRNFEAPNNYLISFISHSIDGLTIEDCSSRGQLLWADQRSDEIMDDVVITDSSSSNDNGVLVTGFGNVEMNNWRLSEVDVAFSPLLVTSGTADMDSISIKDCSSASDNLASAMLLNTNVVATLSNAMINSNTGGIGAIKLVDSADLTLESGDVSGNDVAGIWVNGASTLTGGDSMRVYNNGDDNVICADADADPATCVECDDCGCGGYCKLPGMTGSATGNNCVCTTGTGENCFDECAAASRLFGATLSAVLLALLVVIGSMN